MKKIIWLSAAAVVMTACAESATGPASAKRDAPTRRSSDEITCRSGYAVAYDEFGNPYCAPITLAPGDSTGGNNAQSTAGRPTRQP